MRECIQCRKLLFLCDMVLTFEKVHEICKECNRANYLATKVPKRREAKRLQRERFANAHPEISETN